MKNFRIIEYPSFCLSWILTIYSSSKCKSKESAALSVGSDSLSELLSDWKKDMSDPESEWFESESESEFSSGASLGVFMKSGISGSSAIKWK